MKIVLISFHLVMVIICLGLGGVLLLTLQFPQVVEPLRTLFACVLIGYAGFRSYYVYDRFIRTRHGR